MAISSLHLDAFLAVTQTLNFTKAANVLHITQSALSQRILNLESDLGITLFVRDRSGLKLTEDAQELVRYCQFKNKMEEEFTSKIKSKDAKQLGGVLRVGGFSSVLRSLFLPAISDLLFKNNVRLQILNREIYDLPDLLKRGELDYIFLNYLVDRQDMECVFLGFEENVLVKKKSMEIKDVFLDHDENDETTFSYFKKFGKHLDKPKRHYLDDVYGIIEAAKLGLGYAVLPLHLVKQEKTLAVVNPKQILKIPVYFCFYKQPYYSKLHLKVMEVMGDGFAKGLRSE
jgi:DNA-binding transcriptional LysR family regulator